MVDFPLFYDVKDIERMMMPVTALHDHSREITLSLHREMEHAIREFRECGVDLDRMYIVDSRDCRTSTLFVDGIARFQWKLANPMDPWKPKGYERG